MPKRKSQMIVHKEHSINQQNNFIGGWYIPPELCDRIVNKARNIPAFFSEVNFYYVYRLLHQLDNELFNEYVSNLYRVTNLYAKKYPNCLDGANFRSTQLNDLPDTHSKENTPLIKFQKYFPNKSYHRLHCENDGSSTSPEIIMRHLVFMTYLNDIEQGGETEFPQHNFKCRPEKGLTLIWPAHWTHMHRGISAPNETKYILTGWFLRDTNLKETKLS